MAAIAAHGSGIDAWYDEEPHSHDALMMMARVRTQRVLSAARSGAHVDPRVIHAAHGMCWQAYRAWPEDPVPWVDRLALAQLDIDYRVSRFREHWAAAPDPMLLPGPWPVLQMVQRRDPENREAYHRMLQCFQARGHGALDYARMISTSYPVGSPLLPLVLHAYVEIARQRQAGGQVASMFGFWDDAQVRDHASRVRDRWFAYLKNTTAVSLADLNVLAYVLTASGLPGAGPVFEAIGPYATPMPWQMLSQSGYWQDDFRQARAFALRERTGR